MIDAKTFDRYAKNPDQFRGDLFIDVNGTPERFRDVAADFQLRDFASIDGGVLRAIGRRKQPAPSRLWWERCRGGAKTQGIGMVGIHALAFARTPLNGYVFAADADQAGLLREAVNSLIRLNPWLGEIVTVQRNRIVVTAPGHPGEGGFIEISSSDVGSSYGLTPHLLICDEVGNWPEGKGQDLWNSIVSSAAKRDNCVLLCITNAGWEDSWCWKVREAVRVDPAWIFSRQEEPAPWISAEKLDEQRRLLPEIAFRRLWLNQWTSGGGDALSEADINAAFRDGLGPMTGNEKDWTYVGGVDLGLTRDCSAVVVLAVGRYGTPMQGRIRLAHAKLWRPVLGKKINLMDVEKHILNLDRQFRLDAIGVDPWQAQHMCQRLETHPLRERRYSSDLWAKPITPTGQTLQAIATQTIEAFQDRRLELFFEPLKMDCKKLRISERAYGCRLESPRDGSGHGDTFSAFSLALYLSNKVASRRPVVAGAIQFGDSPLSRAMERMNLENARRRQEWEAGWYTEDPLEELKQAMRAVGRL